MAGFGQSEKTEGKYGVEVHAAELAQLVRKLGLVKPLLVGHSYGAGVVMRAALKDPALYAGVIFASAFLFEEQVPPTFKWAKWPGMGELIFGSFYTQVPGEKFLLAFHDRKQFVSVEHLEEVKKVMGQPGAVYAALETVRGMDYASHQDHYATLQLPALIIWGAQDRVTSPRFGKRLAELLRTSKFKVIEDCGHVPSIEAPLQLSEYILNFAGDKS
jgi:pimeloyl-ACP methyl ester carboxylesterase